MEAAFCVETVEEALAKHGRPEMFNTDQGSQFTSAAFTGVLLDNAVAISMDGKGSWRDNVFVERISKSVKYERQGLLGTIRILLSTYYHFYVKLTQSQPLCAAFRCCFRSHAVR